MPGKKNAETFDQMVAAESERKTGASIYKVKSAEFVGEQLSTLISKTASELKDAATLEPVSLTDTDKVKQRTLLYLRACEEASSFPSIMGLARSMGMSRQNLYDCIWRKSPSATARWLEMCQDSFSDILSQAALKNNCNSVVSIFLQKAVYGMRETVEIVAKNEAPLGEQIDQATLEARIAGSVVLDEE